MSGSVMIVDDSLTVRMDLIDAFRESGMRAVGCESLAQARETLAAEDVALIVLDVSLPDGSGVDLVKEVRTAPGTEHMPILMLSTETEVRDRIRGLAIGSNDYAGKPYDREYVVARSRELMSERSRVAVGQRVGVLVIDDSPTYRAELRRALESKGYEVITAASGEEGLRAAAAHNPAAIICDGVLPGIDGATVIRRLRLDAAMRHTPCLMLTGSTLDRSAELNALDAGADAFVRKAETMEIVLARLAAVLRAGSGTQRQTASLLGPKKVLAVDDSETYLNALGDALRGEGYDIVTARSGEEALEMLAAQPVDCILLDRTMPGIDGTETCRRIKAAPATRDTPVIILTASESREDVIQGLSAGADDYVLKSNEEDVLKARVRAQLRRKQIEDESRQVRMKLLSKELEAAEAQARLERTHKEELESQVAELKLAQAALARQAERLRIVHEIDRAIISQVGPEDIAAKVLQPVRRLLGVARANINLVDADATDVEWFASAGRSRTHIGEGLRFPIHLIGDVEGLRRGEIQRIDTRAQPPGKERDALLATGVLYYLAVPMITGGELIGALSFGGEKDSFPEEQVTIAREVATQLAVAITNARLYEKVNKLNAELEQRVRERTSELQIANRELESFSYSVSHDLRAPLRAIDGYGLMLEEDYAAGLDEEGRRLLGVVRESSKQMARLIDDLLAFSQVGRKEISRAQVDMDGLVREAVADAVPVDSKARVAIGALPPAACDRPLLRQVWTNLVGNALKYSGKRADPVIEIGGGTEGSEHIYWVRDNGSGFDMRYYGKLFGVFQRLHRAEEFEGTGVGLAIVQRIVVRHGGRVWAEGAIDQGACFRFSLPVES